MSKPWGNIGAWAAEAEKAEEDERLEAAAAAAEAVSAGGGRGDSKSFPSLKEAVNTKQKKKGSKMSLQEFNSSSREMGPASSSVYVGLTPQEMLRLPTGPMERSEDELRSGRLGGGFSSYGKGRSSGPPMDRDSSWAGSRRSFGGGFDGDDDQRGPPPRRFSGYDQPSKADEVDNWASAKKSLPSFGSGRANRYESLGGGGGYSRADEVDDWGAGKKPIPPKSWGSGSDFRRAEPDRWTKGGVGDGNQVQERRKLVLEPPRKDQSVVLVQPVKSNKPNPFGAARPREEVLAEKGLDWKKLDLEIEAKKTSRPTSSQSSRPGSAQSITSEGPNMILQGTDGNVKPLPKVNPFGNAKPREVLLEEKGLNWRKMDLELEHRGIDRPETEAEKNLKAEIEHLKEQLEKESTSNSSGESFQGPAGDQISLTNLIKHKEGDLELLIRELDDKVRFGQKVERPRSGSGRFAGLSERPPSRSGSFEDARSVESLERPRSRGMGDGWARQGVDQRVFRGGRNRGFLGNREIDRSSTRERW